jgi:tetratricopeptide (TPR) repeat protein
MRRTFSSPNGKMGIALLGLLMLVSLGPAACGPGEKERSAPAAVAADAEWSWLQQARQRLDTRRAELARATARRADDVTARPAGAEPAAQIAELRRSIEILSTEYRRRLVDFINADPPVEGRPLTRRQQEALRMKSGEEILIARDFIDRGGDYRRAIEIYEAALAVDPANPRLRQELERARGMRYMTIERFARVKEGMTPDQVRAVLGQPNLHNVRDYADRGVSAWFYPKGPDGGAAGVWFQRKDGAARVYELAFEAVPPAPASPASPGQSPGPA